MAPAIEPAPKVVPCGPFSTSNCGDVYRCSLRWTPPVIDIHPRKKPSREAFASPVVAASEGTPRLTKSECRGPVLMKEMDGTSVHIIETG